ncbi:MAG: TPM domain-containing protein [Desulfovibrionaceae bacterium]|nr:TPM domain-containing protein [Desulfovibrionaceae bacterium]
MRNPLIAFLCTALVLLWTTAAPALDVPAYKGRVNDYADMISPETEQRINAALAQLEQTDSTQVAVLTIPSLEGDSLEEFSIRVADAWKVGQKDADNGAILLVSKNDHKIRIEVGYGLEGVLTDVLSGQIIDRIISPSFKAGDFDQGFAQGTAAIIQAVRGEFKGAPAPSRQRGSSGVLPFIILVMVSIIFITERFGRVRRHQRQLIDPKTGKPIAGRTGAADTAATLLLLSMLGGGRHGGGGFGGGGFGGGGFGGFGGGGFGGGGASGGW